ncbi:MAG: chemotaxis protein CheA [Thermodesulfobacteriota bacterium]
MDMDGMEEIIQDFLMDATEMLDELDQSFVELEDSPKDMDLLNKVFRAMHTIKGSAGFLGYDQVIVISHESENILNLLRQEKMEITSVVMDGLLKALDLLKLLISNIRNKDDTKVDIEQVDTILKEIISGGGEGSVAKETGTSLAEEQEGEEDVKSQELEVSPADEKATIKKEKKKAKAKKADTAASEKKAAQKKGKKKGKEEGKPPKLGEILVEEKLISEEDMEDVLAEQNSDLKLGEELLQKNMIKEQDLEMALAKQGKEPKADVTIRVETSRLESVLNLVGELVLSRNMLIKTTSRLSESYPEDKNVSVLSETISSLDHVTTDLQWAVMKTRMQPVGRVFNKFIRMVRDLSRSMEKDVELVIFGEDTELDKNIIEDIGDPLVHLVRNAVDHGIEKPEKREMAGKPRKATLKLSAFHEGKDVVIEVSDDGKGIDPDVIKSKAVEKGLVSEADVERMNEKDILKFIFFPGFSTAEKVTDTSGRGVGMDVVKNNVSKLNGTIDIESEVGKGTTISIRLPLTIAIIQALMVKVGAENYAIPLNNVEEIVRVKQKDIKTVDKKEVLHQRGSVIPLMRLAELLNVDNSSADEWLYTIIIALGENRIGLLADRLIGEEEIVIKSLGDYLEGVDVVKGATITGDGDVVLILDVGALFRNLR